MESHPGLVPSSEAGAASARRIMQRLRMGIELLSDPAALEAKLEEISQGPSRPGANPALFRVGVNVTISYRQINSLNRPITHL